MKKISKVISVVLTALLVMSQLCCVAFADDQATVPVTITSNVDGLAMVTNQIATDGTHADMEGTYVQGGIITFTFDGTAMDTSTLTPENIIITLESKNANTGKPAYCNTAYIENCDFIENVGETDISKKYTCIWKYEPYEATSTSYSISIADMVEGKMIHKVTFTENVKTAEGKSIVPVSKEFTTGRIATTKGYEGKALRNVAYMKTYGASNTATKMTDYNPNFEDGSSVGYVNNIRIDLGNYYDIADVALYTAWAAQDSTKHDVEVFYSNDPDATVDTATYLGTIDDEQQNFVDGVNQGTKYGRGLSAWLHPTTLVRARYIFLKSYNSVNKNVNFIEILSPVDCEYGAITATYNGETVTEFKGEGKYTVSVPVTEYISGSSNGYMIVAGYDASGVITAINCAPVSKADGVLSLATTFTNTTKSLKAVLIKDFTQPQMLTDALVLETPAQN